MWTRLKREARAGVPGLLLSLGVHVAVLLLLAVIVFTVKQAPRHEIFEMGWHGESAGAVLEQAPAFRPVRIESTSAGPQASSPAKASSELPVQDGAGSNAAARPGVRPVAVGNSLGGRGSAGQSNLVQGEGKTSDAKKAVDKALTWLARQQQRDGRWVLDAGYPDAGRVKTDTGATALALLAFLGVGETHVGGTHQKTVQKGIDWLLSIQQPSGDLFDILEEGRDAHFYAHSQATIVLCEALALTHDRNLQAPAEKAVAFLVAAQNPRKGGWKYRVLDETGIGDLSVTGWALMALHTARMAGIDVPPESFLVASSFLDSVQEEPGDEAWYKYRPDWQAARNQRWSMTAEGQLCRQWLGWPRDYPAMQRAVKYLLSDENEPTWDDGKRNLYAWYYTAQVLHNLGGDDWKRWYSRTQKEIVSHQAGDGSWPPNKPAGAVLEYSAEAGRLYFTALCVLVLETPYRHAAIYAD